MKLISQPGTVLLNRVFGHLKSGSTMSGRLIKGYQQRKWLQNWLQLHKKRPPGFHRGVISFGITIA